MRARISTLAITIAALGAVSTAQVPTLVKDINPTGNSGAGLFTCFNGTVYFSANDGVNGVELWKTDGTEPGTVLVKDINPGSGSSAPRDFMPLNGVLHFIVTGDGMESELWRTDGTEGGTQLVLSRTDVTGLLEWITFAAFPGSGPGGSDRIFFRGYDIDHGRELWSTDGTAAGTQLFMDINPGAANSSFQSPMSHDGQLYFTANDGVNGSEPWVSDGTVAGTHLIAETIPGPSSSGTSPTSYRAVGGLVFFRAGTSATGDELWATDGTVPGTGVVRDIYPGINSSLPSNLIEHNGQLHLRAFPTAGAGSARIYQSDGTLAGTASLPMFGYTSPDNLCSHAGQIYFTGIGVTTYAQLWRTDGTEAGTNEITFPGSDVISPFSSSAPMLSCDGRLFFRANYLTSIGQELYTLDLSTGTEEVEREGALLYPNPVMDQLIVQLDRSGDARLLDPSGRLVRSMRLVAGPNTVEMDGLVAGAYILVTESGAFRIMKR